MKTIDLKGKQYAEVKERLKQFRSENPRGLVETLPTIQPDGSILFKARILKDKAEPASAEASGHALGANKGEKAFEKLETIAVGRALALLGYGADGAIASSEEMEEFEEYQNTKREEAVMTWTEKLSEAKDLKELAAVWSEVPGELKTDLLAQKNSLKERLVEKETFSMEKVFGTPETQTPEFKEAYEKEVAELEHLKARHQKKPADHGDN